MRSEKFNLRGKTIADYQSFAKIFIEKALEQGLLQTGHEKDGQVKYLPVTQANCWLTTEQPVTDTGEPLGNFMRQQLTHRSLKTLIELSILYRDNLLQLTLYWYPWSEPIAKYLIENLHETMNAPFPEWMIRAELEAKQLEKKISFHGTSDDFYQVLAHHHDRQLKTQFENYLGRRPSFDRRTERFIEGFKGSFENATLETWQKDKDSENHFTVVHFDDFGPIGEGEWHVYLSVDREKLREELKIAEHDIFCLRVEYKGRIYNISTYPTAVRGEAQKQIMEVVYHAWSRNVANYRAFITSCEGRRVWGVHSEDIEFSLGIKFDVSPTVKGETQIIASYNPLFEPMYRTILASLEPYIVIDPPIMPARTARQTHDKKLFTELRNILAELYSEDSSARRVVADAGLASIRIAFASKAIDNWHSILSEARKTGQVKALLEIVLSEYGTNKQLCQVAARFQADDVASHPLPNIIARYYVYENWHNNKAVVHVGNCGNCNEGKGKNPNASNKNCQWHGPFATLEQAKVEAKARSRERTWECRHCLSGNEF